MIPVCFISVLYYTCVEEICDEKVEFDGSELALLNMGSLFHFLKGRYMYPILYHKLILCCSLKVEVL